MGEGEGRGDWRLEGYKSINGRSPFYSEGEASDGKILNFQYHFWRMLRPYDILAYTMLDPLLTCPILLERKWGRGKTLPEAALQFWG